MRAQRRTITIDRDGNPNLMRAPSAQLTDRLRREIATKRVRAACIFVFSLFTSATSAQEGHLDQGKSLYEFYCYQCHAYSGNANTVAAAYLNPKPRDFTRTNRRHVTREKMLAAVRQGKPGTAMMSFARVMNSDEMAAVVDYIRTTLMASPQPGLAYHTAANGWENHQRYEAAFAFAMRTLPIDTASHDLSPSQRVGKKLFLSACITCHEPRRVNNEPLKFEPRAVSYPRSADTCIDCHAGRPRELLPRTAARPSALTGNQGTKSLPNYSGASPYLIHGRPKLQQKLSESELRGKDLFLANCAFCHAADGSSRNWIGSFLEPRPRELRFDRMSNTKSASNLRRVIRNGIAGTSMPAWRKVLEESEIADLVAFLTHGRRTPVDVESSEVTAKITINEPSLNWTRQPLLPAASATRSGQANRTELSHRKTH